MTLAQHFVYVSQEISAPPFARRHPLDRLAVPLGLAAQCGYLPEGHVWWVERRGNSLFLRAEAYITEASLERVLRTDAQHVYWHLDVRLSERISWPGTRPSAEAGVSDILNGLQWAVANPPILLPISSELDLALDMRRRQVGETVWDFGLAAKVLLRLFEKTRPYVLARHNASSLHDALHYAHAYYARDELVAVMGLDPYIVAAAALTGYTELPSEIEIIDASQTEMFNSPVSDFRELDPEEVTYVEERWVRRSTVLNESAALERATERHQEIVRALARELRAVGYTPTFSRLVDMRIEGHVDEVFFEVTTSTTENILEQVRLAVGQLLEYRFRHQRRNGGKPILLAAVLEASVLPQQLAFARRFLAEVDIKAIFWEDITSTFQGLAEVIC